MSNLDQPGPRRRSLITRVFFSTEERRLRAGWRILAQLILLSVILVLLNLLPNSLRSNLTGEAALLFDLLISLFAITVSVFLARRLLDHRSFSSLGLSLSRWTLKDLITGICISGILMGVVYLSEWASGWLSFSGYAWEGSSLSHVLQGTAAGLLVFMIVGWQEELVSRGYWLQNLEQGLNLFWGVLLSSMMFALAHLGNPHVSWVAILGLLAGGVFLAFGFVRTRSLWLPIGLHIGWNFFEGTVFGFPVSGLGFNLSLILQQVHGPDLITGGAFGPEAGLVILPAILIGSALIYLYTRGRKMEKGE